MDEYVLAAIVWLNEAEASLSVIEFYGAGVHGMPFIGVGILDPEGAQMRSKARPIDVWKILSAASHAAEAIRPDRPAKCRSFTT
jgi:hypothetical protein